MIKKLKKSLSVVLVVLMLLTAVPLAGFVGLQFTVFDLNFSATAADVVASGKCGENVTWTLDSDGVLTISGYGEMYDYNYASEGSAPWIAAYSNVINKVIVEDGVANIGNSAFFSCMNLNEVVLADSVKSIGDYAFVFCGLSEFVIPETVTDIGCGAFYGAQFSSVTIPGSVKSMGTGAFLYCTNLQSLTIGDGVSHIGNSAFLSCISLQSVEIPDSVVSIGFQAFGGCLALESVSIGSGVKTIGQLAFGEAENISSFTVDEDNKYFSSLDGVLYNKDKTVLEIYPAAKKDSSFAIPDSVKTLGLCSIYDCDFETLYIPAGVTAIVGGIYRCANLKNIIVDDANEVYCSVDGILYNEDKTTLICYPVARETTEFEIPYGVLHIADEAFQDADNLVSVNIPESVQSIDDYAFSACSALKSISIPESVVSVGSYAFSNCNSLESISIPDSVISIGECAFAYNAYAYDENNWEDGALYIDNHLIDVQNDAAKDFVVKDSTVTVAGTIFAYSQINSIIIPSSVVSIGDYYGGTYNYPTLDRIIVDAGNKNYCAVDGVLYDKNMSTLVIYPGAKQDSSFAIPSGVKTIARNAFSDNAFLECVIIPDGVEKMGDYAFDGCESLAQIIISDSLKSIGYGAFLGTAYYNDKSNWQGEALYLGNYLINTNVDGMLGLSNVTEKFTIKDGTKVLAGEVFFAACLESITIPGSVETIGEIAFYMCSILKNITIENGVESIGLGAFSYCKSLENITIPESVESVGYGAFYDCTSLESITILNPECEIAEGPEDEADELYGALTIPENTVIYGYKDSTAQKYAEKYGNTFIALDGEDTTVEINISDNENSGIQFDFSEDTFDDSQRTVTLEIRRDTTQSQYLLTDFSKVTAWNMTFYNEAGEEIQPGAPVTVKMPVPEGYNTDFLMVLHIDPQTNQSSMVDFTVEDGFVVFEAGSFSVYALVDTSSEIEDEPTVEPDVPNDEPDEPDVPDEPAAPTCDHLCHKSGFVGVIWKIVRFFWKLFNMNPVCECGAAHY